MGLVIGIIIAVVVIVVLLVVLIAFGIYNGLVSSRLRVKEAWSGIDVQLKRRASLIPNLVETVKGYAAHEKSTLEDVTNARAQLQQAGTPAEASQANNMLTQTLRSLFAVAENYPNLKANENFLQLQSELADIEEKIAYARQFYNTNVLSYNTKTQQVPSVDLREHVRLPAGGVLRGRRRGAAGREGRLLDDTAATPPQPTTGP